MEIWKDIKEYENKYQVSNYGRVKSMARNVWNGNKNVFKKEKILKQWIDSTQYMRVALWKNNKKKDIRVHALVAETFIPNPENKRTVNHKDGIRTNNIISNLEWATYSENHKHAYDKLGRVGAFKGKFGANNPKSKPVAQYSMSGEYIKTYFGIAEANRKTGVCNSGICNVCSGKKMYAGGYKWKYAI